MLNGKVNLGLNGLTPANLWYPILNVWKMADEVQVFSTVGNVQKKSSLPPNTTNSAWLDSTDGKVYLDANGDLINPLPAEATHLTRIFETHSTNILTEYTGRYGEAWVLKFDGTATTVSSGLTGAVRVGNRITGTWPANQSNKQISFTGIDHNDPPRNIRFCPVVWESLLDGGALFNPDWLAEVARGSGIIRFMDWMVTNKNRSTRTFADIPTESFFVYGGGNGTSDAASTYLQGGMPLSVMTSLAEQAESHAWVNIPHVFGTPKTAKVTGITQANPAVVTSANHPFSNGDQVVIYLVGGMSQVNRNTYTVANATTDTFELSGINSTGFSAFTSLGWLSSPYSLSGMTTQVTLFATYFRDNMPSNLITYFEFSNECWNAIFDSFHWLAAQARGKFAGDNSYKMTGYLFAHCMKTIGDVYGPANRSKWKGVLATHLVNPTITNDMITGINQYISEFPTVTLGDLADDLAVVTYWGGNLEEAHAAISQAWLDDSITRFDADLEPTRYAYYNRKINEDLLDGRYTGIDFSVEGTATFWTAQKAIADANGLGFIAYEGGNSNALNDGTGLTVNALWREFFPEGTQSTEDGANYTAIFEAFEAIGGTYPAKFTEANPVNIFGSFGALRYPGDSNPVWDAVVAFNGNAPAGDDVNEIPWIRGGLPGSGGWGAGFGFPLSKVKRKLSDFDEPKEEEPLFIAEEVIAAPPTQKLEDPAKAEHRNKVLKRTVAMYKGNLIDQDDEEVILLQ